jgi:hypothetical protein
MEDEDPSDYRFNEIPWLERRMSQNLIWSNFHRTVLIRFSRWIWRDSPFKSWNLIESILTWIDTGKLGN